MSDRPLTRPAAKSFAVRCRLPRPRERHSSEFRGGNRGVARRVQSCAQVFSPASLVRLLLSAACVALLPTPTRAATPPLHGVGIDETLAGGAVLAEALNQAMMRAHGLPL